MINAFAKAYKWQQVITQDPRLTIASLAERENLSGAYVGKILRLNFVAPDIIKTIMDGRQPRGLKLQDFIDNTISDLWEEQKVMFGFQQIVYSINSAASGVESKSTVGLVNAGFAGYSACLSAIQMMSGIGAILSAGTWVSMSGSQTTQNSKMVNIVASKFDFREIYVNASEINLIASQIKVVSHLLKSNILLFTKGLSYY